MSETKGTHGGSGRGGGRKSREQLGLPPVVNTTIQIEREVIEKARKRHGTLANALRFSIKE
jgi:hypothetical protein